MTAPPVAPLLAQLRLVDTLSGAIGLLRLYWDLAYGCSDILCWEVGQDGACREINGVSLCRGQEWLPQGDELHLLLERLQRDCLQDAQGAAVCLASMPDDTGPRQRIAVQLRAGEQPGWVFCLLWMGDVPGGTDQVREELNALMARAGLPLIRFQLEASAAKPRRQQFLAQSEALGDLATASVEVMRSRVEQVSAEWNALMRSLQSLHVGIMVVRNRVLVWANPRYFEVLGFEPEELLGRNTRIYFFNDEDYESISIEGYRVMSHGHSYAREMRFRRKDGSGVWCHITGSAINPDDLSEGYIWSFADMTEQKYKENALRQAVADLQEAQSQLVEAEKMAALGGLVAGIAHEVNTPLGVAFTLVTHFSQKTAELMGLYRSQQMKRSDLDRYLQLCDEAVGQLVSNLKRAGDLVQSFKRVAVDQTSDDRRLFDLRSYVQEVVVSLTPNLRKAGVRVDILLPDQVVMDSYPGALSQVVANLVMNALIHAFEPGSSGASPTGVIEISGEQVDDQVVLRFRDNGVGIPAELLGKIFDPFFTTKRGAGGSGLGLYIVYNLVTQKLYGKLRCDSVVGAGTTFTMDLPVHAPARKG